MKSSFTVEEKRKWLLKKHLKDHGFEYVVDILVPMLFAFILLKICKSEDIALGIIVSFVLGILKVMTQIRYYKKDYLNVDVK